MGDIDVDVLIEEAERGHALTSADKKCVGCSEPIPCLVERLTDELRHLRSVVAGVEALADEWDPRSGLYLSAVPRPLPRREVARRLRSVLSDTKGEK